MRNARRIILLACSGLMLASLVGTSGAGTFTLTLPDTCGSMGDTLWIPVYTTDVTDSGVYGYNLTVRFDTLYLEVADVTSEGTISSIWGGGALVWSVIEGQDSLRIADFGIDPLTGEGVLVYFGVKILTTAPGDSTEMEITEAVLTDPQVPPVTTVPGTLSIPCGSGGIEDRGHGFLRLERLGPAHVRWHAVGEEPEGCLKIYDARGRRVTTLSPRTEAESVSYSWTGRSPGGRPVAGGVYFYAVETPRGLRSGKFTIIR
jgi:hypothetical protein